MNISNNLHRNLVLQIVKPTLDKINRADNKGNNFPSMRRTDAMRNLALSTDQLQELRRHGHTLLSDRNIAAPKVPIDLIGHTLHKHSMSISKLARFVRARRDGVSVIGAYEKSIGDTTQRAPRRMVETEDGRWVWEYL
jgi:hypothetical protein